MHGFLGASCRLDLNVRCRRPLPYRGICAIPYAPDRGEFGDARLCPIRHEEEIIAQQFALVAMERMGSGTMECAAVLDRS